MRLWLVALVLCSIAATALAAEIPTAGPLRQCTTNPRYFCDARGRVVLLAGSHTWDNFQDAQVNPTTEPFDYGAYLDFLRRNNHNFFRLWVWEQGWGAADLTAPISFAPLPYRRTGPGLALDGKPKFDLHSFDEGYFRRLRERVVLARDRGIYVSVMLFNGWSVDGKSLGGGNPWRGHPFNRANNIDGVDGDGNDTGFGLASHTLANSTVVRLQEAYVKKVIDTLNDLDNVLWEISNESPPGSEKWQYHFIRFIKEYEARKPFRHPVGMTVVYPGGDNRALRRSPADWISPNDGWNDSYKTDPPEGDGTKVIVSDTDHLWGIGGDHKWVWKSFLRGLNPIFMDPYKVKDIVGDLPAGYEFSSPEFVTVRHNLGYVRAYADRLDLAGLPPRRDLSSTGYCLARPGATYLIYQPAGLSFTVYLEPGSYRAEWFDPTRGTTGHDEVVVKTAGWQRCYLPYYIADDAVLLLERAGLAAAEQGGNGHAQRTDDRR